MDALTCFVLTAVALVRAGLPGVAQRSARTAIDHVGTTAALHAPLIQPAAVVLVMLGCLANGDWPCVATALFMLRWPVALRAT